MFITQTGLALTHNSSLSKSGIAWIYLVLLQELTAHHNRANFMWGVRDGTKKAGIPALWWPIQWHQHIIHCALSCSILCVKIALCRVNLHLLWICLSKTRVKIFLSTYFGFLKCIISAPALIVPSRVSLIPRTQYGHNKWALFTLPQAGHLFKLVTSFNAFPAMNLCRFLLWEVFFLGTARNIDSHKSERIDGNVKFQDIGRNVRFWLGTRRSDGKEKLMAVLDRNVGFRTATHEMADESGGRRAIIGLAVTVKEFCRDRKSVV